MDKFAFLSALRDRLSRLPDEDVERSVEYYSEMIDDRIEEGLSEADAVEAVGSVEEIAVQIMTEVPLSKLVKAKVRPKRALRIWEIILLVLGSPVWLPLLAAAFIIVLVVYIVIWAVVVVFYSCDLTFAACAVAGVIGAVVLGFTGKLALAAMFLGAGLFLAGLAVFSFLGCNQVAKGLLWLSKKILVGIKSCFIRKGAA